MTVLFIENELVLNLKQKKWIRKWKIFKKL